MTTTATVRLTNKGKPDRRMLRREEHLAQLVRYLSEPRSVADCATHLRQSARAIYFLFAELNKRGHQVARLGSRATGCYKLID